MKVIKAYMVNGNVFTNKKAAMKAERKVAEDRKRVQLEKRKAELMEQLAKIGKALGEVREGTSEFKVGDKVIFKQGLDRNIWCGFDPSGKVGTIEEVDAPKHYKVWINGETGTIGAKEEYFEKYTPESVPNFQLGNVVKVVNVPKQYGENGNKLIGKIGVIVGIYPYEKNGKYMVKFPKYIPYKDGSGGTDSVWTDDIELATPTDISIQLDLIKKIRDKLAKDNRGNFVFPSKAHGFLNY